MELLEGGTLRDLLKNKSRQVNEDMIIEISQGIAAGLIHLHNQGIIHRYCFPFSFVAFFFFFSLVHIAKPMLIILTLLQGSCSSKYFGMIFLLIIIWIIRLIFFVLFLFCFYFCFKMDSFGSSLSICQDVSET